MGLIAQRMAEAAGESRFNATEWLNDDDYDSRTGSSGIAINRRAAQSVSTVSLCVDILSSAVGDAPRDVLLSLKGQTFPEYSNVPGWVDLPDPSRPAFTGRDYIKQIAASYLFDGNYFVQAWPDIYAARALMPLDPNRTRVVEPESGPGPVLEVLDAEMHVKERLLPHQYLHGKWISVPGELRAISRLEQMRRTLTGAIASEDYASRYFTQGASLSFGVEVPYAMDKQKLDLLRESLKKKHAGRENAHAIGILADGGKFVTGLAPTPEQAQMLETRKFAVEEIARWYGVPPFMVGSQEPGASSYASTDVAERNFAKRVVLPLASAIEDQHNRLLTDTPVPGGKMQFKLNLDHLLRADLTARYDAYEKGVRSGVLKPDEARAKENMGPVPGGDRLYMQSQMVPIDQLGQTPTPAPAASPARSSEEAA